MIKKRPELDTVNPPGQIVDEQWKKAHYQEGRDLFPPTHFEKPVVKAVEEYQKVRTCPHTYNLCSCSGKWCEAGFGPTGG